MRKLTVVFLVLMLFLQVFSGTVVYGDVGDNITIESYSIAGGSTSIFENESVTINLKCKNKDASSNLENVYVEIDDSSSFYGESSNGKTIFTNLGGGDTLEEALPTLVYKGTGNALRLIFTYQKGGNTFTETESLYIKQAIPTDNSSSSSADTSKYVPSLGTVSTASMPLLTAGGSHRLKYTIKNNTGYQAKNVEVSLKMADETKAPLVFDNFYLHQTVESINARSSTDVTFDVKILKTSPEGISPMKLNYEFDNAFGQHFSTSETVYIRIQNNYTAPKLTVENISLKESAAASGAVLLELKIRNLGNLDAENIKVTLGGLKSGGFTAYNSTDVKYVEKISGGALKTVSYQLMMPTSGAAGSNELTAKMEYEDDAGNKYTEQNQIFVPAGDGEGAIPDIVFERIVSPQSAVSANEDFSISLDLKNNGGAAAKNIKVSLTAEAGIIIKSMNPVYITSLNSKEDRNISFRLFASDDSATKNYPIALKVEYEDVFGGKYETTQYVGAFVENSAGKTVPRIIIDNYSMDPFPVNAGEEFTLKMSYLNTSKMVDVSNIKVTVSSEDGIFTPTETGNTFYIESIPSKHNVERELKLNAKPDAEQKSYLLNVTFEYEDGNGNDYTAKETISIRVLQSPRLVIGELNIMPDVFVGQPIPIYVDFYNMGKSILYNLMVKVEGEFQGEGLSYYVGNFESGRSDFFDTQIMPSMPGAQKGSILFSFEDANGDPVEIRKEFDLNVMEMVQEAPMFGEGGMPIGPGMDFPGAEGMMGKPKTSPWIYVGIGAGVLIAGAVVFIILRKRHIRRKELSLDE